MISFKKNPFILFIYFVSIIVSLTACQTQKTYPQPYKNNHEIYSKSSKKIIAYSKTLLGTPYKWGGNAPEEGFDCSGFVNYVYRNILGISLPRKSSEIAQAGKNIRSDQIEPGDLVFFNTLGSEFSHVGIYIGNREFIHASNSKYPVKIDSLDNRYYQSHLNGIRRYF